MAELLASSFIALPWPRKEARFAIGLSGHLVAVPAGGVWHLGRGLFETLTPTSDRKNTTVASATVGWDLLGKTD